LSEERPLLGEQVIFIVSLLLDVLHKKGKKQDDNSAIDKQLIIKYNYEYQDIIKETITFKIY